MDRDELIRRYYELDKNFEKAKGKRTFYTILFFTIFYFSIISLFAFDTNSIILAVLEVILHIIENPHDIVRALIVLLFSAIAAFVHFWVNASIFVYLANKGRAEAETLERMKKQIDEMQ